MNGLSENKPASNRPQGFILCGGKSRRFGTDKARYVLDGKPMILRIAELFEIWGDRPLAIAETSDLYKDLNLITISDLIPRCGPLAGLHSALMYTKENGSSPWIVLLSCDMTFLSSDWLDLLFKQTENEKYQAIIFDEKISERQLKNKFHPFPGFYHVDLIEQIETQINEKKYAFHSLFEMLGDRTKKVKTPSDWPSYPQVNTMEELNQWQRCVKPTSEN